MSASSSYGLELPVTGYSLDSRLELWSRINAVGMLTATGACEVFWTLKPLGAWALGSFLYLIWLCRENWTPHGNFGLANGVTALRLALVLLVATCMRVVHGRAIAAMILAIFVLDGMDGWLARRTNSASTFGRHFDMETDALLILVATHELWQRGMLGIWVLASGLLRYVYVFYSALLPKRALPMPPSRFGRSAFSGLAVGIVLAFTFTNPLGAIAAGVGTLLVGISFVRSFYWTWLSMSSAKSGT